MFFWSGTHANSRAQFVVPLFFVFPIYAYTAYPLYDVTHLFEPIGDIIGVG